VSVPAFVVARVLHVLAVLLWIGGVAMVTTVILPAVKRLKTPAERVAFFEEVEGRFAWQARATTLIAGISGFYMVHTMNAWSWYSEPSRWYLHAMTAVWVLFTLMLFVFEPLFLHRWFLEAAERDPEGTFRRIERLHRVLLTVSLVTVAGAVAGSHGWLWI
jgi:uncharacterized membrane protein